jgi:hypothetical protein
MLDIIKLLFEHGVGINSVTNGQSVLSIWVEQRRDCPASDELLSLDETRSGTPAEYTQFQHSNSNDSACGGGHGKWPNGIVAEHVQGEIWTTAIQIRGSFRLHCKFEVRGGENTRAHYVYARNAQSIGS